MWTVIKIDKKKLQLLKEDFKKYLGDSSEFYIPKIITQKFVKNKLYQKEIEIAIENEDPEARYFFLQEIIKMKYKMEYNRDLPANPRIQILK